jgi:hypothetical protein
MIKILLGMAIMLFAVLATAATMSGSISYNPTHDRSAFVVEVKIIPREKIDKICHELTKMVNGVDDSEEQYLGCSVWSGEKDVCRIYVPQPLHNEVRQGVLAVWGHEILHCTKGSFHD